MMMFDMEKLWSGLQNSTDKIYTDVVMELMSEATIGINIGFVPRMHT